MVRQGTAVQRPEWEEEQRPGSGSILQNAGKEGKFDSGECQACNCLGMVRRDGESYSLIHRLLFLHFIADMSSLNYLFPLFYVHL